MIVVNTSLALQWVLAEPDTDRASSLLTDVGALASSDVLFIETANVLGKKVRHSEIPMEQAREGLLFIRANVPTIVPGVDLVARALELSVAISHPVYDCIFLACAERLGCPLATRDRPFAKRLTEGGFGALLAGPVA